MARQRARTGRAGSSRCIRLLNKYGERLVKILCTGGLQFLSATETKIELQENQRSDQIIDALIQEVIFPPALSDSWVLGDPDLRQAGRNDPAGRPGPAYSDFDEGVLTLNMAGDNWVRQAAIRIRIGLRHQLLLQTETRLGLARKTPDSEPRSLPGNLHI